MRAPGVIALIAIVVVACGSFGDGSGGGGGDGGTPIDGAATDGAANGDAANEGDIPGCPAESCVGRTECKFYDFETGCGDWTAGGDGSVVCNGALRVSATSTKDAEASVTLLTPSEPYSLRLAGRITLTRWDGGRVLVFGFQETPIGILIASETPLTNKIEVRFCRSVSDCAPQKLTWDPGSKHQLLVEMSAAEIKLSVDCVAFVTLPGAAPPLKMPLGIIFGKTDGDPIEGTLDDVVVSYE